MACSDGTDENWHCNHPQRKMRGGWRAPVNFNPAQAGPAKRSLQDQHPVTTIRDIFLMLNRMIKTASLSVGLVCAILAAGCDSSSKTTASASTSSTSSSSSSSTSSGSLELENVYVAFPPPVSHTQEATITVRGAVTDSTGISDVQINGVSVSTEDNWARWTAEVPLTDGDNAIDITYTTDTDETHAVTTLQVNKGLELAAASWLVLDSDSNRLLILDVGTASIVAIDLDSGVHTQMSPLGSGENYLQQPLDMTLDRAGNRLIINRRNTENPIVLVDLTTGDQSLADYKGLEDVNATTPMTLEVSGGNVYASGLEAFSGISVGDCLAPVRSSAQGATAANAAIVFRLDPDTGESSILSRLKENIMSNDASLLNVQAMADDAESDTLYALDSCSITLSSGGPVVPMHRIKNIDKTTGDVSWFYPESQTAQNELIEEAKEAWAANADMEDVRALFILKSPVDLVLDVSNSALLVLDENDLVRFDINSGESSVIAGNDVPPNAEPQSLGTISFVLDRTTQKIYTYDIILNQFLVIDVADGSRTQLGDQFYHPDTVFIAPNSVSLDIGASRFFTTDRSRSALFVSDLNTGARERLADNALPADNVRISQPIGLTRDDTASNLYVLSQETVSVPNSSPRPIARLININTETGVKSQLLEFDPRVGFGTSPLYDVVYSTGRHTAYVAQQYETGYGAIHRLHIREDNTVEATLLTAPNLPDSSHPLRAPIALALDEQRNRLLAVDRTNKALYAIDLTTGERTPVSEYSNDEGAVNLNVPRDIWLNDEGTQALVLDSGLDAIVSIDLESGARSLLVSNPENVRQRFIAPIAMAVHPAFEYALVIEESRKAVMAVDLITNERVRVAR